MRIEEPMVTVHTVDSMTETEPPSAFIRSTQPVKRISFINPDFKEYKEYEGDNLKKEYDQGEVYQKILREISMKRSMYLLSILHHLKKHQLRRLKQELEVSIKKGNM